MLLFIFILFSIGYQIILLKTISAIAEGGGLVTEKSRAFSHFNLCRLKIEI